MRPLKFVFLAFTATISVLPLFADQDFDLDDFSSLKTVETQKDEREEKSHPFSVSVYGDAIQPARIEKGYYEGDHVQFTDLNAEFGMVVYYCQPYKEGLKASLRYSRTYIHWENNPLFTQDYFDNGVINISGFSGRFSDWFLRAQVSIAIDLQEFQSDYIKYDLIFWARYAYRENVGFHLGCIGYTGIDLNWACPIIGFDWQISPKWKMNLVYPVNISLEYLFTDQWTFAIASRTFDNRQRVDKHESYPKAVIRYRNIGAEFAVKYNYKAFSANVHAGITFDGRYRIANSHNRHGETYHLGSAAYFGAEAIFNF